MEDVKGFFGFGSKKEGQEPLKEGENLSELPEDETPSSSSSELLSASSSSSTSSSASSLASANDAKTSEVAAKAEKPVSWKKKTLTSAITFHITQQGYEKHPQKEFNHMKDRYVKSFP